MVKKNVRLRFRRLPPVRTRSLIESVRNAHQRQDLFDDVAGCHAFREERRTENQSLVGTGQVPMLDAASGNGRRRGSRSRATPARASVRVRVGSVLVPGQAIISSHGPICPMCPPVLRASLLALTQGRKIRSPSSRQRRAVW